MTPVVYICFRNRVVDSYSCLASQPLLICFGHRLLTRLCIFRRHSGLDPIVSGGPWICVVFLVWLRPRFVLFRCFLLAKRKSGGEICGSSLLPFFVCSLFHDASVVKPKSFMFFAHFFTASLIVRTEP